MTNIELKNALIKLGSIVASGGSFVSFLIMISTWFTLRSGSVSFNHDDILNYQIYAFAGAIVVCMAGVMLMWHSKVTANFLMYITRRIQSHRINKNKE